MAISFQPTEAKSPNQLPEPGYYYGKIVEASMKQPKDVTKNEYLNVCYELYDANKNKCGRIYDIIAESDKPFMQYKLQRFGQALDLVGKSLELKDLAKIIVNKVIIFSIKTEKNERYGDRSVIDISDEGIYYAKSEAAKFFDNVETATKKVEDAPAKIQVIDDDTDPDDDSAPFDVGTDEDF